MEELSTGNNFENNWDAYTMQSAKNHFNEGGYNKWEDKPQ
jgi:hypothetical protein